mgnify:CR=1 FL=1
MKNLAEYLGLTESQLDELDIELQENTGSDGEHVYSFWFEVPNEISEEVARITKWKPGQVITDIPASILDEGDLLEYSGLDTLLLEMLSVGADPFTELKTKIEEYQKLITEHHDKEAGETLKSVLYGAAIGAFEAYLWEIVRWRIDNDHSAANKIITSCEPYRSKPFKLSEIVDEGFDPKKHLLIGLNNMVWHRIEKISPILVNGLGVKLPSMKFFNVALVKRHHIVHRAGKDTERKAIDLTKDEVVELFGSVLNAAGEINKQLYKLPLTPVATNVFF